MIMLILRSMGARERRGMISSETALMPTIKQDCDKTISLKEAIGAGCTDPLVYFKLAACSEFTGSYYSACQYYKQSEDGLKNPLRHPIATPKTSTRPTAAAFTSIKRPTRCLYLPYEGRRSRHADLFSFLSLGRTQHGERAKSGGDPIFQSRHFSPGWRGRRPLNWPVFTALSARPFSIRRTLKRRSNTSIRPLKYSPSDAGSPGGSL